MDAETPRRLYVRQGDLILCWGNPTDIVDYDKADNHASTLVSTYWGIDEREPHAHRIRRAARLFSAGHLAFAAERIPTLCFGAMIPARQSKITPAVSQAGVTSL